VLILFKNHNSDNISTAKEIHDNFLSSFGIDLDLIYNEYSQLLAEEIAETESNDHQLKVEVLNNIPSNHDSTSDIVKWKSTFYLFFVEYEKLLFQLNTKNQNDVQQDECSRTFGIDIQVDLLNNILIDEADPELALLNIYGINVSMNMHDIIIQKIEDLEMKFKRNFHHDLRKCYIDCFQKYREYKVKKSALATDISSDNQHLELFSDNPTYYEHCWNVISSNNIGDVSIYNTFLNYHSPFISGNRRDLLDPLSYNTNEYNQEKLAVIIMDQFHLDIEKKGIAVHINEQLEYLISSWNNNIKIAVLLDLYWGIQEILCKMNQVKIIRLPKYEEADFNMKVHKRVSENRLFKSPLTGKSTIFTPAFLEDTYTIFDKRDIAEYINGSINSANEKNILYPFVPNIKYCKSSGEATVAKALSEITMNISLNKEIHEFYKNNFDQLKQGNNDKYKTFEDLLSIYTEQFSYTKIQDYYLLEDFTSMNLSMKLYDYLCPIAFELLNDNTDIGKRKQCMLYNYLNEIVSALFRIKSPYLRLRVTDIVIQSYGTSKYLNKSQYITALLAMAKILNQYIDRINDTYNMVYDAIFYYYTKRLNNKCDYSLLLDELDLLINQSYTDYIRIDPDSIYDDVKNKSNPMWRDLLDEKKGNRRTFYHNIIQSIMLNRSQN
jgi:hypothetical protein